MVPEARSFFLRENRYLLTMQQVPSERLSLKSESTMTLLFFNQQSFTAFADFVRKFPMHDIIYSSLSCNFPSTFRSMFLLRASILKGVSVIRIFLVFFPNYYFSVNMGKDRVALQTLSTFILDLTYPV